MKNVVKGSENGTIFCIHGNSSSAKVFHKLLKTRQILNTKISVDLKGHGNNQHDDYSLDDFTFESQKQYVKCLLSEVDDDILLVGHSLGGHIAIEVAHEINTLKGMVIMGTPPVKKPINFEEAFLPVNAFNAYFTEKPSNTEIVEAGNAAVFLKQNRDIIVSDFKKANPLTRKAVALDVTQNKLLDQFSLFTTLKVPKYIIAGDSDLSVNKEYLKYVKDRCLNNCEIINLINCGHFPSIDRPQKFVEIISSIAQDIFRQ